MTVLTQMPLESYFLHKSCTNTYKMIDLFYLKCKRNCFPCGSHNTIKLIIWVLMLSVKFIYCLFDTDFSKHVGFTLAPFSSTFEVSFFYPTSTERQSAKNEIIK